MPYLPLTLLTVIAGLYAAVVLTIALRRRLLPATILSFASLVICTGFLGTWSWSEAHRLTPEQDIKTFDARAKTSEKAWHDYRTEIHTYPDL